MPTMISNVGDLSPTLYKTLYGLNFRGGGLMQGKLKRCRNGKSNGFNSPVSGKVGIVTDDDDKIMGWVLMWRRDGVAHYTAYFYVCVNHRRKGVGTELLKLANQIYPKPRVCPHDEVSRKFFLKHQEICG